MVGGGGAQKFHARLDLMEWESSSSKRKLYPPVPSTIIFLRLKVTVQFKTEGNGQNEIVSHMDRSEVKL